MHLEILVEDQSGKQFLDIAMRRVASGEDTFKVIAYKGIGKIPKDLAGAGDPQRRMLLDQLPRLLRGYGIAFARYPADYKAAVVVICDLDEREFAGFHAELSAILEDCDPRPNAAFCLAIEEGEAWLLGDIAAIRKAYPAAREKILNEYVNDSICGTWEKLADAVYPGGAQALSRKGWQAIGLEKSQWAINIAPQMDFSLNKSPSFCSFRGTVQALFGSTGGAE